MQLRWVYLCETQSMLSRETKYEIKISVSLWDTKYEVLTLGKNCK